MPLLTELDLPRIDPADPSLRGERFAAAMTALEPRDGWLAAQPFGALVTDRESGEFFLRSRETAFPGLTIAQLFGIDAGPLYDEIVNNIITLGGADHARLRHLVNPALTPRRVERYRPAMRRFIDALLDPVDDGATVEFVEAIAKPYPSQVIAHVMGAPLADAPRLHHFSNWIQRQFDAAALMTERPAIEAIVTDCYAYIDGLIDDRRAAPGEDLITDLITAEAEGDRLSRPELRNLVLNLLVGGVDTSQSQLAHAVRLLAAHPDQWTALRADPRGLALAAVDEALRFEPITPFSARITEAEIEHRGVTFPAGTVVLVSAWHANRDGVVDGDRFDIRADRAAARVLTFGAGIHYCVGANLARAELGEALARIAERVRAIEPAGAPVFGTPAGIYGLEALPLRFMFAT